MIRARFAHAAAASILFAVIATGALTGCQQILRDPNSTSNDLSQSVQGASINSASAWTPLGEIGNTFDFSGLLEIGSGEAVPPLWLIVVLALLAGMAGGFFATVATRLTRRRKRTGIPPQVAGTLETQSDRPPYAELGQVNALRSDVDLLKRDIRSLNLSISEITMKLRASKKNESLDSQADLQSQPTTNRDALISPNTNPMQAMDDIIERQAPPQRDPDRNLLEIASRFNDVASGASSLDDYTEAFRKFGDISDVNIGNGHVSIYEGYSGSMPGFTMTAIFLGQDRFAIIPSFSYMRDFANNYYSVLHMPPEISAVFEIDIDNTGVLKCSMPGLSTATGILEKGRLKGFSPNYRH